MKFLLFILMLNLFSQSGLSETLAELEKKNGDFECNFAAKTSFIRGYFGEETRVFWSYFSRLGSQLLHVLDSACKECRESSSRNSCKLAGCRFQANNEEFSVQFPSTVSTMCTATEAPGNGLTASTSLKLVKTRQTKRSLNINPDPLFFSDKDLFPRLGPFPMAPIFPPFEFGPEHVAQQMKRHREFHQKQMQEFHKRYPIYP